MSEEKLKDFGTLLKESMALKGVDLGRPETISASSEGSLDNQLNDTERSAILEKVAIKSSVEPLAQPPSAKDSNIEDTSTASFGDLLSKTIELQENMRQNKNSENDGIREEVISKSKISLTEDMLKRFMR